MTELLQDVKNLVASSLGISEENVGDQLAYGDVPEWDSMGHMDVMMALEEHFGVEITTESIAQLVSVPLIYVYLQEHPRE